MIVPLSADFTPANITDNKMYESITSSLPSGMVRYVVGNEGYDDHKFVISAGKGFLLVFPLQRYEHTIDNDRLALLQFYKSEFGQHVYSQRSISVEPLIEHTRTYLL